MKIKTVTTHTITFSIQSFGIHHTSFGKECSDIGAAIIQLQLANAIEEGFDWMIVCDVHTDVGTSEV